jgi:hypothetical protein
MMTLAAVAAPEELALPEWLVLPELLELLGLLLVTSVVLAAPELLEPVPETTALAPLLELAPVTSAPADAGALLSLELASLELPQPARPATRIRIAKARPSDPQFFSLRIIESPSPSG